MSDIPPEDFDPEAFQRMIAAQADHASMANDELFHSFVHLFDEVTPQQLAIMARMLRVTGGGNPMSAYYSGVAEGLLYAREGVCFVCDKDHDDLLSQDILSDVPTCSAGHPNPVPMTAHPEMIGKFQCPQCGAISDG